MTGIVTERSLSGESVPVAEAYVLAKAGAPEGLRTDFTIAEAVTDEQGRYRLSGLPAGRVTVSIQAHGYYTVSSGGLEADSIARSCPERGDCGQTDFEIARGAVLEGWLNDAYGDPLPGLEVLLTPASKASDDIEGRYGRMAGRSESDDRGYFRIWGLKPGRYELVASERGFMGPIRRSPRIERQIIEIAPGETHAKARVAFAGDEKTFTLSGEVVGSEQEGPGPGRIMLLPMTYGAVFAPPNFVTLKNGKFAFSGIQEGEYMIRLMNPASSGEGRPSFTPLGVVRVDRDIADLKLTPQPPTGLRGRVEFVDSPEAALFLQLVSATDGRPTRLSLSVRSPEFTFEEAAIPPGEYKLQSHSPDHYLMDNPRFQVIPGQMQEVTIRVSNQRAVIRGTARLGSGEARAAAAHFTIGLRGERGKQKIQADDSGGFVFNRVIPGEYEIAAWEDLDIDVEDEEAWRRAAENVRRLVVEAGFETDVDLTVVR